MTRHSAIRITRAGGLGQARFSDRGRTVLVVTDQPGRIAAAATEVRQELAAVDAACSRYRPGSELEAVNRAHGRLVTISPLLCEAVAAALRAAEWTGGAVDPTLTSSSGGTNGGTGRGSAPGHGHDPAPVALVERPGDRPAGAWRGVVLNRRWGTIHVPAGVRLDLAATATALAADRATRRAHLAVGCGVLVRLGADLAVAGPAPEGGWRIRLAGPDHDRQQVAGPVVTIGSGGLATAGCDHGLVGRRRRATIEPLGRPGGRAWRSVSVHAPSCLDADIAATASMLHGEAAPSWLAASGFAARLVGPDGRTLELGGWPAEQAAA